ncbi:hypothetical protein BCR35DRAFT_204497 [Leucosporidium creatinivorum]|uniref:Uncharacterized protein n=1 Tax=Leucosporidium creatinivorum TaxID=106004 RepID=A0A1Y2FZU8_9BASI|nr:hypothetical protein BCR35DRAFT_204497 [Leucosporidium creatinivorum]
MGGSTLADGTAAGFCEVLPCPPNAEPSTSELCSFSAPRLPRFGADRRSPFGATCRVTPTSTSYSESSWGTPDPRMTVLARPVPEYGDPSRFLFPPFAAPATRLALAGCGVAITATVREKADLQCCSPSLLLTTSSRPTLASSITAKEETLDFEADPLRSLSLNRLRLSFSTRRSSSLLGYRVGDTTLVARQLPSALC